MSLVGDTQTANLANANTRKASLQAVLVSGSHEGNLTAIIVPVAYAVTVQQTTGSGQSVEDARALATSLGLELYEG